MTEADLAILAKAFAATFFGCGFLSVVQPPLAQTGLVLCTIGAIGLGGCAVAFGTPNAGWLIFVPIVGSWSGYFLGAVVRDWLYNKDAT